MQSPAPPSGKYALLISGDRAPLGNFSSVCSNGAHFGVSTLEKLVETDLAWWRKDLGERRWNQLNSPNLMVMLTRPAIRPGVLDVENTRIMDAVRLAWYALQLAQPILPDYGEAWLLGGHGDLDASAMMGGRPGHLGRWEEISGLVHPWFRDEDYSIHYDLDWPRRTVAAYEELLGALDQGEKPQPVVDLALVCLSLGLRTAYVDQRVPNFVRSAECILGVPKHGGKKEFAERGLRFIGELKNDPYLAGHDLEEMLLELYMLRNACVHGKVVEAELLLRNKRDDVHRLDYLAGSLANRTTRWALRQQVFMRTLTTRADLEGAWASHKIDSLLPKT